MAALALLALPAAAAQAAPSPAQLDIQPGVVDYGIVEVDRGGDSRQVNIQSTGPDDVQIDNVSIDGADASSFWIDWNNCGSLSQWQGCTVAVHFNPQDDHEHNATLHIGSSGSDFTAELTGVGGVRRIAPSPSVLDFGAVDVGTSTTRSMTLDSTGNVPFMSMVAIPTGGDIGAFKVLEDGCSMRVLMPADACQMKVRFSPFEADDAEATLAIIGDGNPTLITLRGVGRDAAVVPSGDGSGSKPAAKRKRAARIAFNWRRGLPAPYRNASIDLGVARCKGARKCRAIVRTRLVTMAGQAAGVRTTKVETHVWNVDGSKRIALTLPRRLDGTPVRLIATLRTRAHGLAAGRQRLNVALVPGWRHGPSVVVVSRARR